MSVVPMKALAPEQSERQKAQRAFVECIMDACGYCDDDDGLPRPRNDDVAWAFEELWGYATCVEVPQPEKERQLVESGVMATLQHLRHFPATKRDITVALGSLVAAFPSTASKPDLDAFAVILVDNLPDRLSYLALRVAIKALIGSSRFLPAIAEILSAVAMANMRIGALCKDYGS